jgi:general stress protein YciG
MAGTITGGKLAAKKNIEREPGFYARIGAKGGRNYDSLYSPPKGFAAHPELARIVGAKGGRKSKRGKKSIINV